MLTYLAPTHLVLGTQCTGSPAAAQSFTGEAEGLALGGTGRQGPRGPRDWEMLGQLLLWRVSALSTDWKLVGGLGKKQGIHSEASDVLLQLNKPFFTK